ncbi:MAG: hypothetical protein NC181_02605 [Clostridium sp.]|nr:hypothetical protein [Clostridium sp.]MCM1444148.1 hypothetical protein [Candidatus Amulumruptor caecigallinarius]
MKKGFTLIELIGIIIILSLIVLFSFPSIIKSLKSNDNLEYEKFLENLYMAAETYYQSNKSICNFNEKETCDIEISILADAGLVKESTINPSTNKKISRLDMITLKKSEDNSISYTYTPVE